MKWLSVSSTRGKLLTGFGLIIVMLVILISVTYINLSSLAESQDLIHKKNIIEVVSLLELRSDQNAIRAQILEKMISTDYVRRKTIDADIEKRSEEIDTAIKNVAELEAGDTEKLKKIKEARGLINEYRDGRKQQNSLIERGRRAEAEALGSGIQSERYEKIRKLTTDLSDTAVSEIKRLTSDASERAYFTLLLVLSLGAVIAVISVLIFWNIISSLRSVTRDISEGIGVLSSSASEIVTTTTQVAASASETATAVTETTTTVEEVRQTAQLASQKARAVQDTAQKAAQAVRGGEGGSVPDY